MTSWKAPNRSTVSSFIVVKGAMDVVQFAKAVFDAVPTSEPLFRSDGSLWNIELNIGGSTIMVTEAESDIMHRPAFLYVHVEDCDATFKRALEAGAVSIMTPEDQFYGDRDGGVQDPADNWWWIATHREDLRAEEIEQRARRLEAGRESTA